MGQRGKNIPEIFPGDNDNDPKIKTCVQVHAVQRLRADTHIILHETAKENPSAVRKRYPLVGVSVSIGCPAKMHCQERICVYN